MRISPTIAVTAAIGLAIGGIARPSHSAGAPPTVTAAPNAQSAGGSASLPGDRVIVGGCVIRFDTASGAPRIHANASHRCAGVRSVSVTSAGELQVNLRSGRPVISVHTTPDETLVSRGILAGPSGGSSVVKVRLYSTRLERNLDLRRAADKRVIRGSQSNLWVSWLQVR